MMIPRLPRLPIRAPDGRLVAALAAGAVAGWYYLGLPGRSLSSAAQDALRLLGGGVQMSSAQQRMVEIIASEAAIKGLSWLVPAAVANAYAESRLDPLAVGDSGRSVGLFQLNSDGAGAGMSVAARQDPAVNAARIFEVTLGAQGGPVRAARGTATNADLAALFAQHVERCWECGYGGGTAQLAYRRQLVTDLYGATVAATVP